ncbi:MAG: DnaJ domain-containing protein [Hyphomicrobiaceae bacterium]|nr:DnaJ domain-containing protein [Hyphomicrobiaceae bacterium]
MATNSKYFDSIRSKRKKGRQPKTEVKATCEWPECDNPAPHLAPKGRGREGEYFHFCVSHVREYNKSYNFFKGMSDDEATKFHEGIPTGHRPTWKASTNRKTGDFDAHEWGLAGRRRPNVGTDNFTTEDPLEILGRKAAEEGENKPTRKLPPMAKRSLLELGLTQLATAEEIKIRFKELAKRHHPDSSGGTGSEEKLRDVIKAYNYLKKSGMC